MLKKYLLIVGALTMLTGCDVFNPPPVPPKTDISFTRYQLIYLDVSDIDFVDEYQSPLQEPNVEHLVPTSPTEVVRIWVKDRLRASGLKNRLQVITKDGSIVATPLPKPEGFTGTFYNQLRRYDAKLEIEMRIYSDKAMSDSNINIVAKRSATLSEKATVLERKAFFDKLVKDLMESANAEIERQMFRYFAGHISYSQTP